MPTHKLDPSAMRLLAMLTIGTCSVFALGLAASLSLRAPPPTEAERISDTGTLVVVMRDGCGWCDKFRDELGPKYRRSPQQAIAPLTYIDAETVTGHQRYRFRSPVYGTPTLVLFDKWGREVGRHPGYPGSIERLASIVDQYTRKMQ
jgi:hypothetical protein